MIKKKIKLYYKNFVSKTFEKIHGKVLLKKNSLDLLNISQVNDFFFKTYGKNEEIFVGSVKFTI